MRKILLRSVLLACSLSLTAITGCRVLGSVDVSVTAWEGELLASTEGPTGSAAALSQGGQSRASIQISGGSESEAVYRWRIRFGTCSNPGAVVGGLAQYPTLEHEPGTSTTSNAILTDPMHAGDSFHAVLIREVDDTEVACGQLQQV